MGNRISTGMGIEKIIGGGFPEFGAILLSGGPGTGKTLLSLSFMAEGVKRGENCVYITVSEKAENILRACEPIESLHELRKEALKENGKVLIEKVELGSKGPNYLSDLFLKNYGYSTSRVVIDNVNALLDYSTGPGYKRNLISLINSLQEKAKSSLLICETSGGIDSGNGEAYLTDGVINLSFQNTGEIDKPPPRTLSIMKMRWTAFDANAKYPYAIENKGISVDINKRWF